MGPVNGSRGTAAQEFQVRNMPDPLLSCGHWRQQIAGVAGGMEVLQRVVNGCNDDDDVDVHGRLVEDVPGFIIMKM